MERLQPLLPQKSSSFSSSTREDKKLRETDRNLSLDSIKFDGRYECSDEKPGRIDESKEEGEEAEEVEDDSAAVTEDSRRSNADDANSDLATVSDDIDRFIIGLAEQSADPPPEIPDTVHRFIALVEREIIRYDAGDDKWSPDGEQISLLDAIDRLSKLTAALSAEPSHFEAMSRAGGVLHHAMCFLEDEFFSLLEDSRAKQQDPGSSSSKTKRGSSFKSNHDSDRCILPQSTAEPSAAGEAAPAYPPEIVARLAGIAAAMVAAGYETDCCQVFSVARRNAFEAGLSDLGFEKASIDDVQRMAWDSLESEIATWIKAFRHSVTIAFPAERELCEAVFSGQPAISAGIFHNLARGVTIQLLNFAEAVAMAKRSAEKLFKVLDMYEALRDMMPKIEVLFRAGGEDEIKGGAAVGEEDLRSEIEISSFPADLRSEIISALSRLGEAAVSIFCDLEGSIKSETGKTPVPGGAVHPLTRYVMNYLKYACEYHNTLEQVFSEHKKSENPSSSSSYDDDSSGNVDARSRSGTGGGEERTAFASQLVDVMDLLQSNLEVKSKLYKDLALSNIFMMNNGRYIVQKIKGSAEINRLLGETWCRRRSSDLRQCHKNYQRETWSRVLGCFKDEGLTVRGNVVKAVLKERFKSFNAMFEEIHKAQSSWVVSDEQLQSELRVSVSAVVVPAYRSFLGRFSQYLDAGRQTEKYIKFGAEDLETYIDELFDGNPAASIVRKRT